MDAGPLIVTTATGQTPLDKLTRLVYPPQVIHLLNTPIVGDINVWSLMHIASGYAARWAGLSLTQWMIAHALFEVAEIMLAELKVSARE